MFFIYIKSFPTFERVEGGFLQGHIPHIESHFDTAYFSGFELNLNLVNNFFRLGDCIWLCSILDLRISSWSS